MGLRKGENRFRQYDSAYLSAVYNQNIEILKKEYRDDEKVSAFDGFEHGVKGVFNKNAASANVSSTAAAGGKVTTPTTASSWGCE